MAVVPLVFTLACNAFDLHLVIVPQISPSAVVEAPTSCHVHCESRSTALLYAIEGGLRDPWKSGYATISKSSFSRVACDAAEGWFSMSRQRL